jgi:hypothetical protein
MKRAIASIACAVAMLGLMSACGGTREADQQAVSAAEGVPRVEAPRISVHTLRKMLGEPDLLVLDLRIDRHWDRSEAKIAGAVRRDPDKVEAWKHRIDKGTRVVTYCA